MKIVATSDLHGTLPVIPECDLLIIGGDVCPVWNHDRAFQRDWLLHVFNPWLEQFEKVVGTFGNHDFHPEEDPEIRHLLHGNWLIDETVVIDGLTIHGSPYTPTFYNWAFMKGDNYLAAHWDLIPDDIDILITHGPAFGTCDVTQEGDHAGSKTLATKIKSIPRNFLHICGHIHEANGIDTSGNCMTLNVSHMTRSYNPINPPEVIDIGR